MSKLALFTLLVVPAAWAQEAQETPAAAQPAPSAEDTHPPPAPAVADRPLDVTAEPGCTEGVTLLPQPMSGCAPSRWLRVGRIAVEVVLGGGLGAVGELAGAYLGLSLDILTGHEGGTGMSVGAIVGALLTVAPSVWLGGAAMGGDGSFGWTLLGGAAGTALSVGVIALKNTSATWAIAAALPVLGATVAYELSSNLRRAPKPAAPQGVSIVPTVGPTSVGVAGTF